MDPNDLEIIVNNKDNAQSKQNCIKIEEGNTSEIEFTSHSDLTHK